MGGDCSTEDLCSPFGKQRALFGHGTHYLTRGNQNKINNPTYNQGITQRNPEYIKTHGPKVEQQLAELIASCGSNPTREYNSFLNELKV